jgi:KaiC/GvpD/RAD55 family RecA-like ATPase
MGVADLDHLSGGVPVGSVVLLWGDSGSGHQEFALTSAAHLMMFHDDPVAHPFHLGAYQGPVSIPGRVLYVSTSRSRENLLQEVDAAFDAPYRDVLRQHLVFRDLSPSYFADSVVPASWSSVGGSMLGGTRTPAGGGSGPLGAIADLIEDEGERSLVIIDSLTDLLVRKSTDTEQLITLVKGLRRRAKELGGLVYLLLTKGVGPASLEQALSDSVDGVLSFSWQASPRHSQRQRTMVIEKFLPVLAHLREEQHGRFVIMVKDQSGLVTTQYERV